MFLKNSRYNDALAFEPDDHFSGSRPRTIDSTNGVIEHLIVSGDRLDLLARHYYNDERLWWRILDANPDIRFGDDVYITARIGESILIPPARE